MKMNIDWHEDCLKNQKSYLSYKKSECECLLDEINRIEANIEFYSLQIQLAKKKGLLSFDHEKLGMKFSVKGGTK